MAPDIAVPVEFVGVAGGEPFPGKALLAPLAKEQAGVAAVNGQSAIPATISDVFSAGFPARQ
ncbi:MAG: hypothetical protein IOC82_16145 [Aestuariivirga sp.]|uniref:hypothetical protein n=1 Tax=Aestuariivirga sp. TaxID=2650926 RepID=UPI0025BFAE2E|nr:hypothetical protein [Aestuariivirga sp.]MCA3562549.1 hypothetical protein [Aestuariivirga sp.]